MHVEAERQFDEGLEILLTENGELTMNSGPAEYAALRKMSEEAGVELTSICGGGDLSDNDPAAVATYKAQIRKRLEAAEAEMGAPMTARLAAP